MPQWKGILGKGFAPEEFDPYVSSLSFTGWRPQFVVVHNTAIPTLAQWHNVSGDDRMKNLEAYYRDQQGWSAGPHLFIADDLIWVFTPLTTPGVHSPSWNAISWGVEIVGDYSQEDFGPAIKGNVLSALATLHGALGLEPERLRLHKEDPKTTHNCPGFRINKSELIVSTVAALVSKHAGEHVPGSFAANSTGMVS